MKKITIAVGILVVIAVVGLVVWQKKDKQQTQQRVQQSMEQDQNNDDQKNNSIEKTDTGNWKTYRNEEYRFGLKYPSNWDQIEMSSNLDNNIKDSFIFQKEKGVYFAVFTNGGFGHGIQDPRITFEDFKKRKAKMFWYDYQFPNFIYILEDYPEKWSKDNRIEIKASDVESETEEAIKKIYDSFEFLE